MLDPKGQGQGPGDPLPPSPPPASSGREAAALLGVQEFRKKALALGFGVITLSVVFLLVVIYLQFATPVLWGSALAILFFPLHRQVLRRVRGRTTLAASISTVLTVAIVFIPAMFLLFDLVNEVQHLWPRLEGYFGPDVYSKVSRWIVESPFRRIVQWALATGPDLGPNVVEAEIREAVLSLQTFLLDRLRDTTGSVPGAVIRLAITGIVYFSFLKHGAGWVSQAKQALPLAAEHAERLFSIAERTMNAVFRGVIVTAGTQAVLAGLGYWVADAPTPLLLASITFIAALVPFFGPAAVWLPTAGGLFLVGRTEAAIGLALWGTLVVSLVDNILRPYLIGREVRLPLLWLLLAILGGLKLFGFLGIVIGPIALALAAACYRIYVEERRAPAS